MEDKEREGEDEREELELERKVWSKCFLCEEEYSKEEVENIRMNEQCLHSFCLECITQSASTSLLCPICHSPLPSPLSSLPINFTLCYWQTLSPPPPPLLLLIDNNNNNNNKKNKDKEEKRCDECEKNKAEKHCSHCDSFLCSSCSNELHSRRSMKNHSITPINLSLNKSTVALPISSPIICYFKCNFHNQRTKELFCMTCNECVCVDCTNDSHFNHAFTSVFKKVQNIKEEWKKAVEEVSNDLINNHLQETNIQYENLLKVINQMDEEIILLEEKLKILNEKKERKIKEMKKMKESKENVNQTTRFLLSFIENLPSLPLSSFLPSSSSINNNNKINNKIIEEDNNKKEGETRKRINIFFERENLFSLYSKLIPTSSVIKEFPLLQNQNLISHFGTKGSNKSRKLIFNNPLFVAFNDKLNMIAVSDFGNNRVRIMDKEGSLIFSFYVNKPAGIAIIPSLNLLAVSSAEDNLIVMYDIYSVLTDDILPLRFAVACDRKKNNFNNPQGIGFCEEKEILAISDHTFNRIILFKRNLDNFEHLSFIPLPFKPQFLAISSSGDQIIVTDNSKANMYKEWNGSWREEGEIALPPLATPRGVAINSSLNYFVICDGKQHRLLFFNLTTCKLFCIFRPTISTYSSTPFFKNPCGISIDNESDLISVSSQGSHSISLFRSPI